MYIIQTNTLIDQNNETGDFQSHMYQIQKQTWNEFKEYILSEDDFTYKLIKGTMNGSTKPSKWKVLDVKINDDFHLEILAKSYSLLNIKYYMVTDEEFSNLLK